MAQDIGLRGRLDLTQFNANVQSFMRSITGMNNEVSKVAKESAAGAAQAGKAAGALGVNWQRVKDIVTGIVVIDVFRQISRGLRSIVRDAFDATAVFQSLQITLEAILARDFAKQWGIPVAEALTKITIKAQELLGWVREVAVTTPFSVETLASALAYGQAFGFNVEQSKRLTLATGDFVAGMGLTDQHMQRIIYNFGQMLASGRVLGRELRDLANNFVPIRDITQALADEAGIPFEEMKKAMSEARVSAEQFIGTFVRLAEEDFEGAMERMARTIRGVQQNVSDFIRTLFGLELLGPVMERVAAIAADALDAAFSPETIRGFAVLGETLLSAFNNIYGTVTALLVPAIKNFFKALGLGAPTVFNVAYAILFLTQVLAEAIRAFRNIIVHITNFINSLSARFDTTLGNVVKNAAAWGGNIVVALAQGMAQAIVYIVQVLNQIARIFTYWLRGSSPPKLLPDLTLWGQQAMQAWLDGWTSADFGVFNDIASMVTRFIRSLAHEIPETQLVPKILGARSAIERAINDVRKFGEITKSTLKSVVSAIHGATGAMKDFIRESFQFAKVAATVEAAKKILDFDIELGIPVNILGQTVENFRDIIRLASKFEGTLGDAIRQYAQSLEAVRLANIRVEHAQEGLNAATEFYEKQLRKLRKLQDDLRKKEDESGRLKIIEQALASGLLTEEEKRRLELEKEGILLEHKINALETERDVAVDAAKERLEAEEKIADAAKEHLDFQRRMIRVIADEQLAAAREQLEMARGALQLQIDHNSLLNEQAALLKRLAAAAGEGEMFEIEGLDFEGFSNEVENALLKSREEIKKAIDDMRNEIFAKVREFIDTITAPFKELPETLRALFDNVAAVFTAAGQSPAIQSFVESIRNFIDDLQIAFENLRIFWEENGPGITEIIQGFFNRLGEVLKPALGAGLISLGETIDKFGDSIVDFTEYLIENGPQIQESLQGWVDWVFEEGIPKLQDFATTFKEDIIPAIKDFAGVIKDNAPTIIAIITALGTVFLALRPAITILSILSRVGLALIPLQLLFQGLVGALSALGTVLGPIATVIGTALSAIGGFVAANLVPLVALILPVIAVFLALKDNALGLGTALSEAFKSVGKALKPVLKPLQDAFKKLVPSLKNLLKALAPVGKLLVGVLKIIGTIILSVVVPAIVLLLGFITGLVSGLITGFTAFLDSIKKVADGITRFVRGIFKVIGGLGDIIIGIFNWDKDKILEGIEGITEGLIDVFEGLILTLEGLFEIAVTNILEFFRGFGEGVINFFSEFFDSLGITDKFQEFSDNFSEGFDRLRTNFATWLEEFVGSFVDFYEDFIQFGRDLVQSIIDGIDEWMESSGLRAFNDNLESLLDAGIERFVDFLALGKDFIINILDGIRDKFEGALGVYERFKEFLLNTIAIVSELTDDLIQAGKDIIAGIIEGLWEKATDLYKTVKSIIKKAIGAAEEESETESPSKKTKEIAINWMIGFQEGILSQLQSTKNTLSGAFSELMTIPENLQFDLATVASDLSDIGNLQGGLDVQHLFEGVNGGSTSLTQPAPQQTNIQNLNIEINPTYREIQSEASIYYDVQAALAHISR